MVEETGSDKFKNNSEVRNYDIITGLPLRRTFWDIAEIGRASCRERV